MNDDEKRIGDQLLSGLIKCLEDEVRSRVQQLKAYCESPIEIMLGAALLERDHHILDYPWCPLLLARQDRIASYKQTQRLLVPQYKWREYRIDWVVIDAPCIVFIECDGHEFHERTKKQAARDRLRDRTIQSAGISILRFTGSEIFADAVNCADQVTVFVEEQLGRLGVRCA